MVAGPGFEPGTFRL